MPSQEALNRFTRLVLDWGPGYRKLIRTYIAFKRDGGWHLEYSMTMLLSDLDGEADRLIHPIDVETETILVVRELVDIDASQAPSIVEQASQSPLSVEYKGVQISVPEKAKERTSYFFEPLYRREFPGNWRWPALTVTGDSLTDHHLPNRDTLDLELRSCDIPFADINDLFLTFNIPQSCLSEGYSSPTSVWVISPPAILLPDSSLSSETANIKVKCPVSVDPKNISVGIRAFSKTPSPTRKKISSDKFKWKNDGEWLVGTAREDFPEAVIADIHLNYNGDYLGHHWINDPSKSLNSRLLIHRLFDTKEVMENGFFNQKADFFEDQISVLMNLLGFSSLTYGGIPALKDAPDILAYSPYGHLLVIECTTTDVGRSGKLLKLNQRTKEIRDGVLKGGLGITHVQPIMCTLLQRDDTKACWEEAANFGISLVCQENIMNLISRLETPPNFQELYDGAVALIPKSSKSQSNFFNDFA